MKRKIRLFFVAVLSILTLLPAYSYSAPATKLLIAMGQEPNSMDPSACWAGSADYQVSENYAEYLIDSIPSGELKPGLATAWKISPDGKVVDFTLRKGVKFHSGDLLTAKDVQFSFERGRAINSTVKTRLSLVEKLEIVDGRESYIDFQIW